MLGRDRLNEIAQLALESAQADQTEVLISSGDEHLTRFAENTIHQNVSERDTTVRVRAVCGSKVGVATGNDISINGLAAVVKAAETVAGFQRENSDFRSLPQPQEQQSLDAHCEATAAYTPNERAEGAATICRMADKNDLRAAGAFSTSVQELMIANSLGIRAYHRNTMAHIVTVIMGETSSGYAAATAMDVGDLDPAAVGRTAVDKALASRDPAPIDPGEYTVILEEEAVADMLFTLGYLGFGALAVQEKRSFMSGHFGERITGDNITIWDDGGDQRGFVLPFDFEGVRKERVSLIERGVAMGVVYDSFTAGREKGKSSTGHSLPAPNTFGPIPVNLFLAPGEATKDEMLASTERGIWVTRFHYTNPVHPTKTVLTGMTRDGTFLIEQGRIVRPLKNLRFTQSILDAFANAEMISSSLALIKSGWGNFATCVPAMKINRFRFSGTTEF